jgi:VanZ family protein
MRMNRGNSEEQAADLDRSHIEPSRLGLMPARSWRAAAGRILPLGAYSAGILYFGTSRPPSFPGDAILDHDKLLHACVFGGLSVLFYRCSGYLWPSMRNGIAALASIAFAAVFGAGLELIQARLPYRSMEFDDLVADVIGAALCVAVARRLRLERPLFARQA